VSKRLITGKVVNNEEPDWEPLAHFASPYLMSSFMWMFEVATRRGERFHAYKHVATRRTAHIDIKGNGLAYVFDEDRYARYPAWVLLRTVLRPWWEELNATPEEIALSQIAIERAKGADYSSCPMLAPERRRDLALAIEGALFEPWQEKEDARGATGEP
jgi:hypothetical protein